MCLVSATDRADLAFGKDQTLRAREAMAIVLDGAIAVARYRDALAVAAYCSFQAVANLGLLTKCATLTDPPVDQAVVDEAALFFPEAVAIYRKSRLAIDAVASLVGTPDELRERGRELFEQSGAWRNPKDPGPAPFAFVVLKVELCRALLAIPGSVIVDELAAALAAVLTNGSRGADLSACIAALGFARVTARLLPESNLARILAEAQLDDLDRLAALAVTERRAVSFNAAGRAATMARTSASHDYLARVEVEEPSTHALSDARPSVSHVKGMLGVLTLPVAGR